MWIKKNRLKYTYFTHPSVTNNNIAFTAITTQKEKKIAI